MSEEAEKTNRTAADCPRYDQRLVMLPEDGPYPQIPDDIYEPVYQYLPWFQAPEDSICCGHWQWRKEFLGFRGRTLGVMLHPDWADVLEYSA